MPPAAVTHLKAGPDSMRLFKAISPLTADLLKQDAGFSAELSHIARDANVRADCSQINVLCFAQLLEGELAQLTGDEGGNNLRPPSYKQQYDLHGADTMSRRPQCPHFLTLLRAVHLEVSVHSGMQRHIRIDVSTVDRLNIVLLNVLVP
eukprot:1556433-Amphidinium_carterae.1